MRVAMFTETYLPNTDGVVTSIATAKENLEAMGHRVAVFAPGKERRSEGDVHYFRSKRFKAYPEYRMPLYRSELGDVVEEFDPDVIHSHGMFLMGLKAVLAARRVDAPLVFTYHTHIHRAKHYVRAPLTDGAFQRLVWTGLRWYLRRTDATVAPSQSVAQLLVDRAGADMERLVVIPNGVDTDRFHPGAETDLDLPDGPRVLTVGRVAKEKNLDIVVRAATRKPDVSFLVAGKGPELDNLRGLTRDLGADNVEFLGYVPDEELPGVYATSDVFVTASTFETQGLVVLEALASGLPVVTPDLDVFQEVVRPDVNGRLTELDPGSLVEEVEAAASIEGASKAARKTALDFDERRCARRLEDAYATVLSDDAQNL